MSDAVRMVRALQAKQWGEDAELIREATELLVLMTDRLEVQREAIAISREIIEKLRARSPD
jgi:hypothetical protein